METLENNNYVFNGRKYRLRELDLDMMHNAAPLLIRYREMLFTRTRNIDTTTLDAAEYDAAQLKQAINECEESDTETLGKLNLRLAEAEVRLGSGENAKLRKYLNDTEALVLFEILTDAEFMCRILNNILESADDKHKPDIKPWELSGKNAAGFIKKVTADFFLLTASSSGK